ncbi:hypothetical protein [Streptomyces sp. NPDC048436]|uniref:hypothetical protein n=1 Tax=Streptomyces sp. NPDC048436 TaxID=3365550 RepID=UPI00371117FB
MRTTERSLRVRPGGAGAWAVGLAVGAVEVVVGATLSPFDPEWAAVTRRAAGPIRVIPCVGARGNVGAEVPVEAGPRQPTSQESTEDPATAMRRQRRSVSGGRFGSIG